MRRVPALCLLAFLGVAACSGADQPACVGTVRVSTFRLWVEPKGGGPGLPVKAVNIVKPGEKLKYEPVFLPHAEKDKARIALILVPASEEKSQDLVVLGAQPAGAATEWDVPIRASVVGVVFGPHGLDTKKVSSLVKKDEELIPQLANYAEQSSTVEALVQTLSTYEKSGGGNGSLNAALEGFSSQYGVSLPKLDTTAPSDQQAATLLHAVLPSLSSYDPLAQRPAMVQQSAGLAASVASLFLGSPVGLAAGGASLLQNIRTLVSPQTDFRSAFALPTADHGLALCTKPETEKARVQIAYLWMLRIPDAGPPAVSLANSARLPLGWKSTVKITFAKPEEAKLLPRAREWELVSAGTSAKVPVLVEPSEDALAIDLSKSTVPAGAYHLAARWDWEALAVGGTVEVRPFADFSAVKVPAECADRLVEGNGPVSVELKGADFEFVNKVAGVRKGGLKPTVEELTFALRKDKGTGNTDGLVTEVDTSSLKPGPYFLRLAQLNGTTHDVALNVLPPNPQIENLPVRANVGEAQQALVLKGTGLERIERLSSHGALWDLASVPPGSQNLKERKAIIRLAADTQEGQDLALSMNVAGLHEPVPVPDAIQVVGPRPKITSVKASFPQESSVALRETEVPAGSPVSFVLQSANLDPRPTVELGCSNPNDAKQKLSLRPGIRDGTADLDFAGEGVLFLSVDPGAVGQSGCVLTAEISSEATGTSDPYVLGRVVRLPRIEKFSLSSEKLEHELYAGTVSGQDLQVIEKTGWNAKVGYPVQGIPTPVPGNAGEQTLKIELPWPPPAPQASLYIWLRGEREGRLTTATY